MANALFTLSESLPTALWSKSASNVPPNSALLSEISVSRWTLIAPPWLLLVNDEKTTYQVQAGEGVEVAPHVDHRVELTGTVEKTESSLIIKAKALKMVSTSCSQ